MSERPEEKSERTITLVTLVTSKVQCPSPMATMAIKGMDG